MLNWHIGECIQKDILEQARAAYGEQVMQEIAKSLTAEFGQEFSKSLLSRAMRFYEICPEEQSVAAVWQQLSWSHIRELLV